MPGLSGNKQPAVVIAFLRHPLPDSERRFRSVIQPLQIAKGFSVVGYHRANGNGRFLDLLLNQVGRGRVGQIVTQIFHAEGQQGFQELLNAAFRVRRRTNCKVGINGSRAGYPERIGLTFNRNKAGGQVVVIDRVNALTPHLPVGTALVVGVKDDIGRRVIVGFCEGTT